MALLEMKTCLKCGQSKTLDEFNKDPSRKDGRHPYCRDCKRAKGRGSWDDWMFKLSNLRTERILKGRKVCSRCGQEKPLEEFHRCSRTLDGRQAKCAICDNKESSERWKQSPEKRRSYHAKNRERINKMVLENRHRLKTNLITRLGGKCVACGLQLSGEWPVACFDFHHPGGRGGERLISKHLNRVRNLIEVFEKAKGCQLLCANCHRKIHHRKE